MSKNRIRRDKVQKMVGIAILSAIVVVLQLLGSFIRFGPVSVSLVLIPIVVGAAVYGLGAGAFLGAAFAVVVLTQPDTSFFYSLSYFGTVTTVVVKGIFAGLLAGLVFHMLKKWNIWLAVIAAAIVCPVVNTGFFFLGCRLFFWEAMTELGEGNAFMFVITTMIGFNFIAELVVNVIAAPIILRILRAIKKR